MHYRPLGRTGLPLKVFPAVMDRAGPGTVETVLSFCHYELNDDSLGALIPYLKDRDIGIINASPTGMGLLTRQGVPAWHPATPLMMARARMAVDYCDSVGADIVKLAIQFSVAHPDIATTLVGTASSELMRKNIAAADEPIDPELLARVQKILEPIKNHNFTRGRAENRDPVLA